MANTQKIDKASWTTFHRLVTDGYGKIYIDDIDFEQAFKGRNIAVAERAHEILLEKDADFVSEELADNAWSNADEEVVADEDDFWRKWRELRGEGSSVYYPSDFSEAEDKEEAFGGDDALLYEDEENNIHIIKFWANEPENGETMRSYRMVGGEGELEIQKLFP